ncbi:MAG: sigma-E processing peptidase SpoIIGA [Clostridia bacterium]|nr:sigma-E processing peptidase SpoIIGA [Clostridia bacterium]
MRALTVYADILIITNFIVDYFLLAITGRVTRRKPPLWRQLSSAFAAALYSLIIFLPLHNKAVELLLNIAVSYAVCFLCFGFESFRRFIFSGAVFLTVSFSYAGAMLAISHIFKPYGMVINNSVVYFNISPLFLIIFSVLGFLIFSLFSIIFSKRNGTAKKCFVTLAFCGIKADFNAIIDSGNSLTDPFLQSPVVILDKNKAFSVFGQMSAEKYPEKYHAIPCGTVSGKVLLDGFRCESGKIITENKTINLTHPIIAISKMPLCDCEAIVNPLDCD